MSTRFPANIVSGPTTAGLGRLGITYDATFDTDVVQSAPPSDYATSLEIIAPNVNALVAENRQPEESWMDALVRLLPAIAATHQQRELLKVQTDRAKAGLPPLDTSTYGLGVRVGLSEDSKQLLIYGGVALVALVALGVLKFGRR